MGETGGRTRRADSIRNRAAILDAAREQITTRGPEAGMADIAAAAGVAVGTLYRHFPTKTDLVAAVLARFTSTMADRVEATAAAISDGAAGDEQLRLFLADVLEAAASNHAVKVIARALGADALPAAEQLRAVEAMDAVLAAARATGSVRADLTVDDVYLLVATAPSEQPATARARWLDLVFEGLVVR